MLLANKSVAIVGGGPGGLTLAKLLQLKGVNVKLYERDAGRHARVQGAPLDLHAGSGLAAITEAGLSREFRKHYLPGADRKKIMNERADVLYSDHDLKPAENFNEEYFRPEIDRGELRNILLDSLLPGTVIWDSHFVRLDKKEEGWLLHFKNDQSFYADIVIAADGANSKIRPHITNIKPFYTGITMLEGNIPNARKAAPRIAELLQGGKIMAFGNEKNILMGQKGNDEIGFYFSFRAEAEWSANSSIDFFNNKSVLDWFRNAYPGWSTVWQELIETSAPPFFPRPIYCMPLDQSWESLPNLTMLGDAAHVMPPFAGEGANMAMLDALELSRHLTAESPGTLLHAISSYEKQMLQRAAVSATESLANGELMHSENSLQSMLGFFSGH